MNKTRILTWGATLGGLGIALGAFGAHALKPMLMANDKVDAYEIAVRYQIYHAFALLIAGLLMDSISNKTQLRIASYCWIVGIFLFSGSLYALSITTIKIFAYFTPVGGVFFLVGWASLVWAIAKKQ